LPAAKGRVPSELNATVQNPKTCMKAAKAISAIVALTEAGAVRLDIGQRNVPWTVLADPEGSEFCVLSPR